MRMKLAVIMLVLSILCATNSIASEQWEGYGKEWQGEVLSSSYACLNITTRITFIHWPTSQWNGVVFVKGHLDYQGTEPIIYQVDGIIEQENINLNLWQDGNVVATLSGTLIKNSKTLIFMHLIWKDGIKTQRRMVLKRQIK